MKKASPMLRRYFRARLMLASVALSCAAPSQELNNPPSRKLQSVNSNSLDALTSSQAADFVRQLTDTAGGRLAGSPGDKTARTWAAAAMQRIGLEAVHQQPVRFQRWRRTHESGEIVAPVSQELALTALGGTIGTEGPLEAEVIEFEDIQSLETAAPSQVAGRIVFFNQRTKRERDGSGYGTAVSIRTQGPEGAAKLGAVGVVIRSVGTDSNRLPHTGATHHRESVPTVPAAALSTPDADLLHRLLSRGQPVRLRMRLECGWEGDAKTANVIGDFRGTDKADEIVLIGAHLDSWDLATGALDDGAGVGIVLDVARRIRAAGGPHRRTLRVVLFANEENGLSGARTYAAEQKNMLAKHVAALEADSGSGRAYALRYLGAESGKSFVRQMSSKLLRLQIELVDAPAHGGADLGPIRNLGVPVLDIQQDASSYFDIHHTANDTFDKIDPEALAQVSAAFTIVVDSLLNGDYDFGRAPPAPPGPNF